MSLKIKTVFVRKHFAKKRRKKETKQQKSIYEAFYFVKALSLYMGKHQSRNLTVTVHCACLACLKLCFSFLLARASIRTMYIQGKPGLKDGTKFTREEHVI